MAIIILPHGEVKKLADEFDKSLPTVRKALRGQTKSPLANLIRKAALERGGKQFAEITQKPQKKL